MKKKITNDEIEAALHRSGYLLEARIERLLRQRKYNVDANWTYPDRDTGRERELDLRATNLAHARPYYTLGAELLVECINNPQPLAFFTRTEQYPSFNGYAIECFGRPLFVPHPRGSWVMEFLQVNEFHHYCEGRAASQFCTFQQKRNSSPPDWMALHDDDHFQAFKKLSDVLMLRREQDRKQAVPRYDAIELRIAYPVLVLQGDLLEVNPWSRTPKAKSARRIRFGRTALEPQQRLRQDLCIDVVTEAHFPEYLALVRKELQEIDRRIRKAEPELRGAVAASRPASPKVTVKEG
jgi:hypothetical protein